MPFLNLPAPGDKTGTGWAGKLITAMNVLSGAIDAGAAGAGIANQTISPLRNIAARARTGTVRIGLAGTSIASFETSSVRVIVEQLRTMYGDSGLQQILMGSYGGSYDTAPGTGWAKQRYGGPLYTRMVSTTPTASTVTLGGYGDTIEIYHSREADAGAFEVIIDGDSRGTIGGPGAQAYRQRNVFTLTTGGHTLQIKPAQEGRAYLEEVRFSTASRRGIDVLDYTLGGSAMRNMITLMAKTGPQLEGIPIVDGVGLAAHFNRDDVDLWIIEHLRNDGVLADFITATNYAIAQTKRRGIPILFVTEPIYNIGSEPVMQQQLAHLKSLVLHNNVTVVDWHGALYTPDALAAYQALYWPTADKTHPNELAYDVLTGMLCHTLDVDRPAQNTLAAVRTARETAFSPLDGASRAATVEGTARTLQFAEGTAARVLTPPSATSFISRRDQYYRVDVTNRAQATQNAINASSTSDTAGKYIDYTDQANLAHFVDYLANTDDWVQVTIKYGSALPLVAKVSPPLRFQGPTGADMPFTFDNGSVQVTQLRSALTAGEAPRVASFTMRRQAAGNANLIITGRIYEITIAPKTNVPVLDVRP